MFITFKEHDHIGKKKNPTSIFFKKSNRTLFAMGVFQMMLEDDALKNP